MSIQAPGKNQGFFSVDPAKVQPDQKSDRIQG